MATRLLRRILKCVFTAFVLMASPALAQDTTSSSTTADAWQMDSWSTQDPQRQQAASGETFHATTGQLATDPFAVLTTGALWQDTYGTVYSRKIDDAFSLSCQASEVVFDEDAQEIAHAQQVGFQFQPGPEFTLHGDVHGSSTDAVVPDDSTTTTGAAFSAVSHLPSNSIVTVGMHLDRTVTDAPDPFATETNAYDAQLQQPIGKLPLSAVFKSHYEGTSVGNAPATSLPSLEQSLVWKPLTNTTVQMGLRQQQYQEYPGVDHELNEALFADWSQKLLDNVSWHSYAEVLNSKGLLDQAPASTIASGANGTPQATTPASTTSLTSSLPLSIDDQTVTFSTGPSFQLQKDISASLEYSNRWDKNPAPGGIGQEQRVSVSLKGTF
jgi:hypothetical protein